MRSLVRRPLFWILVGALVLRLALWAWYALTDPMALVRIDSARYHYSARALVETGTFSVSPDPPLVAQTARTPGYPAFLAVVYAAVGESELTALFLQALLSLGTIWLVYLTAREVWGSRAGVVGAAVVALDVPSTLHSVLLLTETLFTLATAACLYCGVRMLRERGAMGWSAATGVALIAMVFIRPAAYYLVLPVVVGMVWAAAAGGWGARRTTRGVALLVIPYVLTVGAWQYRNYQVSGSAAFSQIDGPVLLYYRAADVLARSQGIPLAEASRQLTSLHGEVRYPYTAATNERWKQAGREIIRENPGALAASVAAGAWATLTQPAGIPAATPRARVEPGAPVAEKLAARGRFYSATLLLNAAQVLWVGVAALGGLWLGVRRGSIAVHLFLVGTGLYLLLVHAGVPHTARFRVQLIPLLAMYAGAGVQALGTRRQSDRPTAA